MKEKMQIIALGGGGFSMEPFNPLLDDYILAQSSGKKPHICFLPTASGDNKDFIQEFYHHFCKKPCHPSHLSLLDPDTNDFENFLMEKDIIYVGGGHTSRLISIWKRYGLDIILKKAWENGIILSGVSAGAACWFEQALTDSQPNQLSAEKCLGFLKGSFCAHYDNPERRPTFHRLIRNRQLRDGIGVENFAALHMVNQTIKKVVCSFPTASAYIVRKDGDCTIEKAKKGFFLGNMFG